MNTQVIETRKIAPDMERRHSEPADIEHRVFGGEIRAESSGDKMKIGGLAAMFGKYTNMGWFAEVLDRGFFDDINTDQCACLLNHDANVVLGRKKSGTLELKVTSDGLDYTAYPPESRRDVYESIDRGDIYQSSFGFTVREAEWKEMTREELQGKMSDEDIDALLAGGTVSVRVLKKGKRLYDVSPVTFPAYQDTTVAKRSFDAVIAEKEATGKAKKEHEQTLQRRRAELDILLAGNPNT